METPLNRISMKRVSISLSGFLILVITIVVITSLATEHHIMTTPQPSSFNHYKTQQSANFHKSGSRFSVKNGKDY